MNRSREKSNIERSMTNVNAEAVTTSRNVSSEMLSRSTNIYDFFEYRFYVESVRLNVHDFSREMYFVVNNCCVYRYRKIRVIRPRISIT